MKADIHACAVISLLYMCYALIERGGVYDQFQQQFVIDNIITSAGAGKTNQPDGETGVGQTH